MNNSDMCKLYVKSGLLYEEGKDSGISDETYDGLSRILLSRYSKLPKWFTKNITKNDLLTGSASGFSKISVRYF